MRLNKAGMKIFDKWEHIYLDELTKQREQRGDPDYEEGWCIIDDADHVKTEEDAIGIAIFGDDDNAIYHIMDYVERYVGIDEEWACGVTARQMVERLTPYFEMTDGEQKEIADFLRGVSA